MERDTETRISTLEREMGDVNRTLFKGNGSPPMTARMSALERTQSTQTWLLRLILGGVVSLLFRVYGG